MSDAPDTVRPPAVALEELPPIPDTVDGDALKEALRIVHSYHSEFRSFRRAYAQRENERQPFDEDVARTLRQLKNVVQAVLLCLPEPKVAERRLTGYRILLVDDDPAILRVLGRLLESAGAKADLAPSGDMATQLFDTRVFDAAIVDISMPGISGMDFITWMAENHPSTVPIVMSGYPREVILEDFMSREQREQRIEVLEKPFARADSLVDTVLRAIQGAG